MRRYALARAEGRITATTSTEGRNVTQIDPYGPDPDTENDAWRRVMRELDPREEGKR